MTTRYIAEKNLKNVQPVRSIVREQPRVKNKITTPKNKPLNQKPRR